MTEGNQLFADVINPSDIQYANLGCETNRSKHDDIVGRNEEVAYRPVADIWQNSLECEKEFGADTAPV